MSASRFWISANTARDCVHATLRNLAELQQQFADVSAHLDAPPIWQHNATAIARDLVPIRQSLQDLVARMSQRGRYPAKDTAA